MNDLNVTALDINNLFSNDLLYQVPEAPAVAATDKINGKNTLIVYTGNLADNQALLDNIIAAVAKSATINAALIAAEELPGAVLPSACSVQGLKYVWFLGLTPKQAGLQVRTARYQVFNMLELRILFADALENIPQNKRQLWDALKNMYNIN